MSEPVDWQDISRRLRAPFDPADVDFRVQGKANEQTGRAQIVTYVDARTVQDRLDEVVGPGAWAFTWEPVTLVGNELHAVKGSLTIHGVIREDVGTASNFEPSKGAVSDALKRCAVGFGVGRYLYAIPATWMAVEKGGRIPDVTLAQLRASLPHPDGSHSTPARATATPAAPERPQQPERTARPQRQPAPAHGDAGRSVAAPADKSKANGWVTTDGYDPMNDMEMRKRVKAIGITNMADFETFLRAAQDYQTYNRAAINAELTIWEGRYADAQVKLAKAGAVEG